MANGKKPRKSSGPSKSTVENNKALANAKAADAQKAAAEADAKKSANELELARLKSSDARRDADKSPLEQGRQAAINIGAPVAGIVGGYKVSKAIERRHISTVAGRNAELAKLGAETRQILSRGSAATKASKLRAVVATADQLKLGQPRGYTRFLKTGGVKGPIGIAPAAIILAEGVYSRMVLAPTIQNESAKEVVSAVGTASVFAATTLVGERLIQNSTPQAMPAAKDLAAIETARDMTSKPAMKAAATKAAAKGGKGAAGQVAKGAARGVVSRAILPLAVGVAALAAGMKAAQAGESAGDVAKETAKGGTDMLTGGAVTAYDEAKKQGVSDNLAAVKAGVVGVANTLTFGVAGAVDSVVMGRPTVGYDPAAGAAKFHQAAANLNTPGGRAYLNDAAKAKAVAIPASTSAAKPLTTAQPQKSDGQTVAYVRRGASGKAVQVRAYATPKR